jgi:hypothetical protein
MKHTIIAWIIGVLSFSAIGEELTESQCNQLGGVLTEAGCIMASDSDKEKYKNAKVYMPGKEECECNGGRWHEEHGCLAKIDANECSTMGGQVHPELGCVKLLSMDQCEKLGGKIKDDGTCQF